MNAQHDALAEVGAGRVFSETLSGAKAKRPDLDKMLDQLRDGDVVVVTKYDRLARSLHDFLAAQNFSPKRTLEKALWNKSQTDLSSQSVPTIEIRAKCELSLLHQCWLW